MTELEQALLSRPWAFGFFFALACALLLTAATFRTRFNGRLAVFRYEAEPAAAPEPLVLR